MVVRGSVPDSGDLVWLAFDPHAGHEQAGRRPALVLSPAGYNGRSGLALVCPVTSQAKGYPFEVRLTEGLPVSGVILTDHLKSVNWRQRRAQRIARVPPHMIGEVLDRLAPLLGF